MRPVRMIAIASLVFAFACDKSDPTAKDSPREGAAPEAKTGAEALPKPMINPHETADAKKAQTPVMVNQEGMLELTVGDQHHHMKDLPFGENRATWFEGKKGVVGILARADEGFPKVRITATGWRLDQLQLPITLTAEEDQALVKFTYWVGERGEFFSDDEATKRGENKLTITKYEGKRIEGSFEATVAPKVETAGKPVTIKGEFATTLRLTGVGPDLVAKTAEAPSEPSPDDKGEAAPTKDDHPGKSGK